MSDVKNYQRAVVTKKGKKYVFANNDGARGFYRKMGFRESGRIPKAIFYKGRYVDQVLMYLDLKR